MREIRWTGLVCAVMVAVQCVGIGRPFLRHHESAGTQYGKHARNHLKFGLGVTRGVMLDVSGPSLAPYDEPRNYFYPDHPPLPALILAAAYGVFGIHEAVLRVVLLLFSVGAVLLFWRVARRRLEWPWSGAATAAFAWNPMFLYFSIVTVHQVNTLCGILGALLFYLRWREDGRALNYAGMAGSILFGCLCDWPGYYAAAAIFLYHFFNTHEKRGAVAVLLLINVAVFGGYLLHLAWAGGDGLERLLRIGSSRSTIGIPPLHRYLYGEGREVALYFTVALAGAAAVGLWQRRKDPFLWSLLALAADEVAFAGIAADHDYYTYYLGVALALAGAEGMRFLAGRWKPATAVVAGAFLLQSGAVGSNRLTREGGYEFYWRMAGVMNEVTRPQDKLIILTSDIRFYTPYYADRFSVWYDREEQELVTENSGGRRKPFTESDLRKLLLGGRFQWAVTADREGIRKDVRALATADDQTLRRFGVHDDDRAFLGQHCGPPVERGGFLLWRLPGR